MDTSFWQSIVDSDCAVPAGYTIAELTPELIAYLGSTDERLRDDFAFEILSEWLARDGAYTGAELRDIGAQMITGLQAGLGESGTDTVFGRAFAALILGKVIDVDTRRPFLSTAELHAWLDAALAYFRAERDLRGYVPARGWAHAVAHSADTLFSFARNPRMQAPELERILDAIAARLATPADRVFHYLEDERLAFAAMTALHRNLLDMPFLAGWLERLAQPPGVSPWRAVFEDDERLYAYHNSRQFLRTLYFQLTHGVRAPAWIADPAPLNTPIALRAALLSEMLRAIRAMGPSFYAEPAA